jgi:hypothetical protein
MTIYRFAVILSGWQEIPDELAAALFAHLLKETVA